MNTVNRGALIVRPKQPYLDWANGVDGGPDYSDDQECTVYLAPDFYNREAMEEWLPTVSESIFEHELWSWVTEEGAWPKQRDHAAFLQWFEVEYHSVVVDLCDNPPAWDVP